MAQAKKGRPPKQPIAQRITNTLEIAQNEINTKLPIEHQNFLVPVIQSPEVIVEEAPRISKDAKDDYDFARSNLYNLLESGNKILEGISELASEGENARTYEVAGNVLKTLLEGTRELMTLQKDIREVAKKSNSADTPPINIESANEVTNNTMVFEGATTMEMLEILKEIKRKKLEQQEQGSN